MDGGERIGSVLRTRDGVRPVYVSPGHLCDFATSNAWVLACGLMRYAFVAAGLLAPPLRRPLPPSRRRQAVCQ